jgi:hypothetical protein
MEQPKRMMSACQSVLSVKSVAASTSSARRQVILFAAHLWSSAAL